SGFAGFFSYIRRGGRVESDRSILICVVCNPNMQGSQDKHFLYCLTMIAIRFRGLHLPPTLLINLLRYLSYMTLYLLYACMHILFIGSFMLPNVWYPPYPLRWQV